MWEYEWIPMGDRTWDEFQDALNASGMDGWELVNVVHVPQTGNLIAFMKRPMRLNDLQEQNRKRSGR